MSKIAKAAGMSAATLYVYYDNKEDMFRKVYMDVKKHMTEKCSRDIDPEGGVEEAVRKLCGNLLDYMQEYTDEFLFIEQACNSPMTTDEMLETLEQYNKGHGKDFSERDRGRNLETGPHPLFLSAFVTIRSSRFSKNGGKTDPCFPMWILIWSFRCAGMQSNDKRGTCLVLPFLQYKLNEYSIKKRRRWKRSNPYSERERRVIRNEIHRIQTTA